MRSIVESSLRFRGLVIGLAVALVLIGAAQLRSMPVDVVPEFTPTSVEVQTEALGLSAAEVEQLITVPLEAGPPRRRRLARPTSDSESVPGLSSIDLYFKPGTDLYASPPGRCRAADPGARRCPTSRSRRRCSSRCPRPAG